MHAPHPSTACHTPSTGAGPLSRRARALEVDAVVPRLRQLAQEAHRLRREAAPDLADEHASTSCPPSSAAWYLAVRATPSLRGAPPPRPPPSTTPYARPRAAPPPREHTHTRATPLAVAPRSGGGRVWATRDSRVVSLDVDRSAEPEWGRTESLERENTNTNINFFFCLNRIRNNKNMHGPWPCECMHETTR